jgi:hypothetical protein
MIGQTNHGRGGPVVVPIPLAPGWRPLQCVLIRRATGQLVVRPFRGPRKEPPKGN